MARRYECPRCHRVVDQVDGAGRCLRCVVALDRARRPRRVCRLEGCARICPPAEGGGRPPEYCCDGHRIEAKRQRDRDRVRRPYRKPNPVAPPRACACGCGKTFSPSPLHPRQRYASRDCKNRHAARQHREAIEAARPRVLTATALRPHQVARERAKTGQCPECASALAADGSLLYCKARCGWSVIARAA